MHVECGCGRRLETPHDTQDQADHYAWIKGWGVWPGLRTEGGQPAPRHLCPACRSTATPSTATRAQGPPQPIEGQQSLWEQE